uniref:Disease resistance protein RGA3 n=1 Tax=Ananas comosus var. bracteatus TaxID=296719 RepID=A0A6V7QLZ3_ANACO|nr:unnamed protein product [Ananas comosus var. bracteatus]
MPRLEELHVIDCPKLRALPKSLQQLRALRILRTTMAHSLSVIEDFLFITELTIEMNIGIERVSNLPSLKKLAIWGTPALKCVDNLRIDGALKKVGRERTEDAAWLNELRSILDEANDLFDDVRHEGEKLPSASSSDLSILCCLPMFSLFNSIRVRHNLAIRIRALDNRIGEVAKDQWIFNHESVKTVGRVAASMSSTRETCEIMEADVVGREIEDATDELVEMIVTNRRRNFQVAAVAGTGGIGKTTLAQKVYNNPRIGDHFQVKIWMCVTQKYSDVRLLQDIIRKAGGSHGSAERVSDLLPVLSRTLGGRRIFLVLDDVWRSGVWTDLLRWELLCKRTYLEEEEEEEEEEDAQSLRSVGVQIVNKCGGLPLAIKVIAGVLTTKEKSKREWERVLKSNAWSMSELPGEFRGALYLSYHNLPPHLKQCFLSFCLYPEDHVHCIWDLRRMWVAEGFVEQEEGLTMEELAEQYYFELIRRSLLQPDPRYVDQRRCKVHDLLRSLGQYLSQGESYYGDPQSLDATAISKLRRLSIAEGREIVTIPAPETERLRLRTLLLTASPPRIEHSLFSRFPYLQNANSVQSTDDIIDQPLTAAPPGNGAFVLANKAFLKELAVSCTPQTERAEVPPYTEEEISKIEDIFEKLHPPTCLERLWVENFYNQHIPSWMLSSSLGSYLPHLTYVNFIGLPLCPQLPPLGQLPHLRYLQIREALAIVTIGPELLGNGVGDGVHAAAAFPKLEFLFMIGMPNWEEWSLVGSETGKSSSCSLRVMPRLEELRVIYCPELRALPKGLQQLRALRILKVERAHSLSVIEDFLFITELKIIKNDGMERISNLPALRKLTIWDNSALKCVDNLVALQYLELQDYSMKSLPEWLLRLAQQRVHLRDNNLELVMRCGAAIIQRCLKGGPDWPIIECFSRVSAYTKDRSAYLEYTKQSGCYRTNQ